MVIASPSENVYYYECSYGQFRLTYFIPPKELEHLYKDKLINKQALEDFPDGVDLGCTEADYNYFKEFYGYRPEQDPESIRRAFFAIFSTTHNWKNFYGSGFIPAVDLEDNVNKVDGALLKKKLLKKVVKPPPEKLTLKKYHQIKHQQALQQTRAENFLIKLDMKGIDPGRTLTHQTFSHIKTAKGEGAESVFIRLHQKKRTKEER